MLKPVTAKLAVVKVCPAEEEKEEAQGEGRRLEAQEERVKWFGSQ